MRKAFFTVNLIIILMLAVLLPGCTRVGSSLNGSGKIIDQDVKIADFNSLNVQGAFDLEINQAESFKVTVSTDENLISRVLISLERKTLKLRIEAPATFLPTSLKVKIAMPQILGLNLSGGAKSSLSGFKSTSDFDLFLSEGSTLDGSLEAGTAIFNLSGASQVSLKGTATGLQLDCRGGSKLDLGDLVLTSAQVKLEGGSEAVINVTGLFNVILNNKSKIYFLGNPIFTSISVSGDSTMTMVQK